MKKYLFTLILFFIVGNVNRPCYGALFNAIEAGEHEKAIDLLKKNRNMLYQINAQGETPLHVATRKGYFKLVALLTFTPQGVIEDQIVNARDNQGDTPLHKAIKNKHEKIAGYLIRINNNLSIQNNEGNTPLHLATEKGMINLVKKLLEQGALKTFVNKQGKKPIDLLPSDEQHIRPLLAKIKKQPLIEWGESDHTTTPPQEQSNLYNVIIPGACIGMGIILAVFFFKRYKNRTKNKQEPRKTPTHPLSSM